MTIKVVLDTSAIITYPSVAVGELIAEVVDDGGMVGLPVTCLAAASLQVVAPDRVRLLAAHKHAERLALSPDDWERLAAWWRLLGRVDCATAATAARAHGAYLATAEPEAYDDDGWGLPIIGI